jgi:hypothetical protein
VFSKYLDIAVNVATLFAAIAVVAVLGQRAWISAHRPTPTPPFQVGESVPAFKGLDVAQSDQTLLMVLRHNCGFCAASVPFYRELGNKFGPAMSNGRTRLVVVTTDDPPTAKEYVRKNQFNVNAIVSVPPSRQSELRILGTPTLLLTDKSGRINRIWSGQLDELHEAEVTTALTADVMTQR